ncbi:MAG: hypothetical protein JWN32_618, partial [Solirubrobacterales bacterium]|nr:hypothetical protein [Solirubrobacterales bacterium]
PQAPDNGESAVPDAPAAAPGVPQLPPDQVMLTLRTPDQEGSTGQPIFTAVDAGGRTSVFVFIRNQSGIVDNYDLRVEGLPEEWWTIFPNTVYLVPYGTAGNYEQEVEVVLHPPRAADAEARPWAFNVVVLSKAHNAQASSPQGTLTIHPYTDIESELTPDRATGRRKATFELAVANRANARTGVDLVANDDEGVCDIQCPEPQVVVEPGETVTMPMVVHAPKRILVGRPLDRRLQVSAQPMAAEQPGIPKLATFRQKPYLPWWLAPIVPLLIIAGVLAYILWPRTVTVPELTKVQGTLAAQKLLDNAHLKLNPQIIQKVVKGVPAGKIYDQSPAAGKKVKKDSQVTIAIAQAAGGGAAVVPDVTGGPPATADTKLRDAKLALGAISPQPADPQGKIASQIPVKGTKVTPGTAVNVFEAVAKPATNGKGKKDAAGAGAGAAAGAAKAAGGPVIVANIAKQDMQKGASTLSQEGLVPQPKNTFAAQKPGTVVGTDPVAGTKTTKGADVTVLISVGYPRLAYDDFNNVLMADGGTGKKLPAVTKGTTGFVDPTWSPDGKTLVYRGATGPNGTSPLFVIDTTKKDATQAQITSGSDDLHDPTFAPNRKGDLLAAIRVKPLPSGGSDGDLCFLRLNGTQQVQPNCITDPQWNLGHRIAWSPDGTKILVFGIQAAATTPPATPPTTPPAAPALSTFGLVEYQSALPFSADQNQWGQGKPATDVSTPGKGVIDASFRPDGKQIALVANTDNDTGSFHVFLTKPTDLLMAKAKALPTGACDASWRPDGGELLIAAFQPQCPSNSLYAIARVDPANPTQVNQIVAQGIDPAWQPVQVATAPPLPSQQPGP